MERHDPDELDPDSMERLLSSSGLGGVLDDDQGIDGQRKDSVLQALAVGGSGGVGGIYRGGRPGLGGGGDDDGDKDGGFGYSSSNSGRGSDSTDAYYRKMIKADPNNSLLLGNYARFLKEVTMWIIITD